jgi:two-component system CheB/CheR fusion protein
MNDELRDRTDEALAASAFLSAILGSIHQSVVVVDPELRVTAWSRAAADLWGLREDEVRGEHFLSLDIGLPVGQLRDGIRQALAGDDVDEVTLEGHDRRGHPIRCTVTFDHLRTHTDEVRGVILVMVAERTGPGAGAE